MTAPPIVIVGAGAAGSCLVRALAAADVRTPIVLVDPAGRPEPRRSWASWSLRGSRDPALQGPGFRQLRVSSETGSRTLPLRYHEYTVVRGDHLWEAADISLARCGGRRLAAHALSVSQRGGLTEVETTAGTVEASWVFDSVGLLPSTAPPPATVWLQFAGWEVQFDADVVDPDVVTLMDFRVPQHDEVRFAYTLPRGPRRALVELTALTTRPDVAELEPDLRRYLDRVAGEGHWRVLGDEGGRLPLLARAHRRHDGRVLTIGTAGGLVKASTGYGYQLMRRDAAVIAAQMAAGREPRGLHRLAHHRAMDAVFLRLAATDPAALVAALDRMFAANPVDRVLSFLDESTRLPAEARLAASLPPGPFLRAAGALAAGH